LPPFRRAIAAGVDSVMVAHVTVPALDSDPNHVATISPAIVSDLLEKQLGFKGIIVTDALDMAGLTHLFADNIGRAAVEAFKAGNDLLLIPADFPASYNAMLQAVQAGEISRERLDRSVLKILKAKASLGLQEARLVDVGAIDKAWASWRTWLLGNMWPTRRLRWFGIMARFCRSSLLLRIVEPGRLHFRIQPKRRHTIR